MPPAAPLENAAPPLSQIERVVNTFIAPRKTFEDIRRSASWWLPWILGTLAAMAFLFTVEKKIGYEEIVNGRFAHASLLQRVTAQMSPEKKQEMIDQQVARSHSNLYTAPLFNLGFALIFALILNTTFNFGLDAQIRYAASLAVVFYAWLPKIISAAFAVLVMMLGVEPEGFDMENPVATHLGALLGSNTDHRYLYHLLTAVDLFSFWWIFLAGLGFATISKRKISTGAAVTVVASWYVVFILLRLALTPVMG